MQLIVFIRRLSFSRPVVDLQGPSDEIFSNRKHPISCGRVMSTLSLVPRPPEMLPYYDANAAPDALWDQPSANGCRNQATRLPTGALHWWHGDKVAKTSCPAPRSPRYRGDMRFPTPTDTSYTARARAPDYERIRTRTFVPRPRRGGGAAHAVPPPAHTARAADHDNDGRYPCLRWPGRSFVWGARGKLAQVKLN